MMPEGAVGIVGGSFDPIHHGHLALAKEARSQLGLERVLLMPAGAPWQRSPQASAQDRLAMARLAATSLPGIQVDDREVRRGVPTYTIDTLQELRGELGPSCPIWLVLGADAFLNLPTWRKWQELMRYAHIAVACRPGYAIQDNNMAPALKRELAQRTLAISQARGPAGVIVTLTIPPLDISATQIRLAIRQGRPPGDLIPGAVLDYIESHHLYR